MGDSEELLASGDKSATELQLPTEPQMFDALKAKIADSVLNTLNTRIPKHLKRKIKALKKIQLQHVSVEVQFFLELHHLEVKYEKLFTPLYEKRRQITNGEIEPTDEECDYPSDSEKEEEEILDDVAKIKLDNCTDEGKVNDEVLTDVKGIPGFWLTAFRNAPNIAETIEEYDEPILKHLIDIKAVTSVNPMNFTLEFVFEPNEYFTNTVLVKTYEMKCLPDPIEPFDFDGPEIQKCKGCTIDWKKGMNVTVKTIKKKQKHKARGAVRMITKTVQNDSFFNFFNPPTACDDDEDLDDETRVALANDFEIGNFIKDNLIPQAVLYFTGENIVDDDFDEEDEEDEEFDEEDEEEDSEEESPRQRLVK